MNQTFMTMAIAKGLDGAIINALDAKMMASIIAAEALAGRDSFCTNYLKAFRAGFLDGCFSINLRACFDIDECRIDPKN
jgi:5-methyltetrahydrofolate--homocysteine methyltransferase